MPARPYILAELTYRMVLDTAFEVAILPWGATEAHNYHLPYATDNIQNEWIAAEAARLAWDAGARVVVLPNIPFGVNTTQLDIPLDINMNPSTQLAVLSDVADALERQGIPKLVVFNGHGGNDFKQMIREVQVRHPALFISLVNWYKAVPLGAFFADHGDHAGEMETAVMQHVAPTLVRPLAEAGDGHARRFRVSAFNDGLAWAPRQWSQVTADTGIGDPRQATPEKGARYLEAVTARLASFFADLAAADPTDLYTD